MIKLLSRIVALFFIASTAQSADKAWDYPLGTTPATFLVPDGTGGAAFTNGPDGNVSLVWLDSKGKKLYGRTSTHINIVAANAHELMLVVTDGNSTVVYKIDRNGKETKISPQNNSDFQIIAAQQPLASDASGFFIHRTDGTNNWFLVRYRFQ